MKQRENWMKILPTSKQKRQIKAIRKETKTATKLCIVGYNHNNYFVAQNIGVISKRKEHFYGSLIEKLQLWFEFYLIKVHKQLLYPFKCFNKFLKKTIRK